MWVFLNDAFLSIVAHNADPDKLLVRGRFKGDIEAVFPNAVTQETPDRDYRFRAVIDRDTVAATLAERTRSIEYTNFKSSVHDHARHHIYLDVWSVMATAQRLWKATKKRMMR